MFRRAILALAVVVGLVWATCAREQAELVLSGRVLDVIDGGTMSRPGFRGGSIT